MSDLTPRARAAMMIRRFGLGARPGEVDVAARDPRAYLLAQLDGELTSLPPLDTVAVAMGDQPSDAADDWIAAYWRAVQSSDVPVLERIAMHNANVLCAHPHKAGSDAGMGYYAAIREQALGPFVETLITAYMHPTMIAYHDTRISAATTAAKQTSRFKRASLSQNGGREALRAGLGLDPTREELLALSEAYAGHVYWPNRRAGGVDHWDDDAVSTTPILWRGEAVSPGPDAFETIMRREASTEAAARGIVARWVLDVWGDHAPAEITEIGVAAWMASGGDARELLRAWITCDYADDFSFHARRGRTLLAADTLRAFPETDIPEGRAGVRVGVRVEGRRFYWPNDPLGDRYGERESLTDATLGRVGTVQRELTTLPTEQVAARAADVLGLADDDERVTRLAALRNGKIATEALIGSPAFLTVGDAPATAPAPMPARAATRADAPTVVDINMLGMLDALSAVVPYADPAYYDRRGIADVETNPKALALGATATDGGRGVGLTVDDHDIVPLGDGMHALNPALASLAPLFAAGRAVAILNVGSDPRHNADHFNLRYANDQGAGYGDPQSSGFLNRLAGLAVGESSLALASVDTGPVPAMAGPTANARIDRPTNFVNGHVLEYWQAVSAGDGYYGAQIESGLAAAAASQAVDRDMPTGEKIAALDVPVIAAEVGGFDTHRGPHAAWGGIPQPLAAVAAVVNDIHRTATEPTIVSARSEAGRDVARGQDHGVGGVHFVFFVGPWSAGALPAIPAPVIGRYPLGPDEVTDNSLPAEIDQRHVHAAVASLAYGLTASEVQTVWPKLPTGDGWPDALRWLSAPVVEDTTDPGDPMDPDAPMVPAPVEPEPDPDPVEPDAPVMIDAAVIKQALAEAESAAASILSVSAVLRDALGPDA